MIRSLELTNFRRHEQSRLEFAGDSQIVAITGRNGAGKTTILEALMFAFYGETRHGRKGIAQLVRRGAEHEGMGLAVEFDIAGTVYRIERRYEKGKHTAALFASNILHTQTADGVTKAVTDLFGMDAVGFKLATIAKQKELDGLAELTPAVRRKTIARLLRLDAVQAAVLSAREHHREAKTAADALAGVAGVATRTLELAEAEAEENEARQAETEANAALAEVERRLGASSDIEARYHAESVAHSRATALAEAAEAETTRLQTTLDSIRVPEVGEKPELDLDQIRHQLAEVRDQIATGQAQAALVSQAANLRKRRDGACAEVARLTEATEGLDTEDLAEEYAGLEGTLADLASNRTDLLAERSDAVARGAAAAARRDDTAARLAALDETGAVCDSCGQEVTEEHRQQQRAALTAALDTLDSEQESARSEVAGIDARGREIAEATKAAETRRTEIESVLENARQLTNSLREATRAVEVYTDDLERIESQLVDVDLDAAFTRRGQLESARVSGESYAAAAAARENALTRRTELEKDLAQARERAASARDAETAAAPSPQTVADWRERQQLLADRENEREMVAACAAQVAGAAAQVAGARKLLEEATSSAARANGYRTRAEVAAKTATLLDAVARRLATQIRPQLEGQISATLQLMSEGRFTAVQVSDDYEVMVCDHDGRFYAVSEFSGGEADLIALAIRLALAQVVSARHGAGGAGFLILDEVFGSQDATRRMAILDALRTLRGTYAQILLISHIEGIETAADLVVTVGRDDEEELARVSIA